MRVFVSSTVFDLIDVRAEISSQLRSLGIDPVMSDDKLSDFRIEPHKESIETCLVNLRACDEVIVILDQRYGPKLGKFGYDDVSATHLEYREAMNLNLPVHFYVRDRTEAEFRIWKKSADKSAIELPWVSNSNYGLFEFLGEHAKLLGKSNRSNWVTTFSNSVDLKAAVAKRFEARILPQRLMEAIQRNEFPLIEIKTSIVSENHGFQNVLVFSTKLSNVGGAPAFGFQAYWEKRRDSKQVSDILASGHDISMNSTGATSGSVEYIIVEYESPIGVSVYDRFRVFGQVLPPTTLVGGSNRVERKYRRSKGVAIEIDDC